jgi:hypothetical protein
LIFFFDFHIFCFGFARPRQAGMSQSFALEKLMSDSNPYEGLFPGDYFIQRINFEGDVVHAYGFFRGKDHGGKIYTDYQCSRPPSREFTMDKAALETVGRITVDAYKLAKLRGWPDEDSGVLSIIAFSGGKVAEASLMERLKIRFMNP